jgi:hypothetical protein
MVKLLTAAAAALTISTGALAGDTWETVYVPEGSKLVLVPEGTANACLTVKILPLEVPVWEPEPIEPELPPVGCTPAGSLTLGGEQCPD